MAARLCRWILEGSLKVTLLLLLLVCVSLTTIGRVTSVGSQWDKANLSLSPHQHPLTDSHEILHTWARPPYLPKCHSRVARSIGRFIVKSQSGASIQSRDHMPRPLKHPYTFKSNSYHNNKQHWRVEVILPASLLPRNSVLIRRV